MTTPADIIAEAIRCGLSSYMPNHHLNAESIIGQLDAAGFDIVARQPDTCPTCGSDDPKVWRPVGVVLFGNVVPLCPDAWHDRGQR